jgi:spermidine synthase
VEHAVPTRAILSLAGFSAAVAQIVLLRELMVVFYGNEISLGLALASWLLWTALGSAIGGRTLRRVVRPALAMAALQFAIAFALPATVVAVRLARPALETVPGEMLGPGAMLAASLVLLAPLCALSGAMFPAGAAMWGSADGESAASMYRWEAIGSAAGGLLAAVLLVRFCGSLEIAWLLAAMNLAAACWTAFHVAHPAASLLKAVAAISLAVATLLPPFTAAPASLERWSQERLWHGRRLVALRNSVYGSLAVVAGEGSRTLYENGVVLANVPDPAAAEEAVHLALLEHPAPHAVLLIGGGINGSAREALRHSSVRRLDYVELDPAVLDVARENFPAEWRALASDPRVHIHLADGRLFLKSTPRVFDVIIVNLPDPRTAQLNRFFTVEFFAEAASKLSAGGILSFQLQASESHIAPDLAQFLQSIHKSLRSQFAQVLAIPGETVHFIAARRAGSLTSSADELLARRRQRGLETLYVSEGFLPFRMTPERIAELERQLRPLPATPLNRDFAPVAYYFDVALWSGQFGSGYRSFFRTLADVPYAAVLAFTALPLIFSGIARLRNGVAARAAAAFSTPATGFSMMAIEVLILLAFQAVYGYVYRELAFLLAAFMAGLAAGTSLASRTRATATRSLALSQWLGAAAPLLLMIVCTAAHRSASPIALIASRIAFPALALLSGALGGFAFAAASRVYYCDAPGQSQPGIGTLYALDLAGSSAGALLFSLWLAPVYGFFRAALVPALTSLAAALSASSSVTARARQTPAP